MAHKLEAQKPPTLVHVARLAGVGIGTASRVLNNEGYVSEATAAKVRAVIEQLQYKPNEVARSLKVRRSGAIGIVVPELGDPFVATCVQAAQTVIRQSGNISILTFSQNSPEIEAQEIDYLIRRQIDGILIIPAGGPAKHLSPEVLRDIPIVSFDKPIPGSHADSILIKNKAGAIAGVRHLLEHRHRKITFVGPLNYPYTMDRRIEGYREVMLQAGLEPEVVLVEPTSESLDHVVAGWLTSSTPPTAVFCGNGLTSSCLLKALAKYQVSIPDQMAVVGFDDLQLAELLASPLTVVRQPAVEIATTAARLLLERTVARTQNAPGKKAAVKRIALETELVLRESCGCKPASDSDENAKPDPV